MVNLEKCVVYFLLLLILNSGVWFGKHVTTDADSFFICLQTSRGKREEERERKKREKKKGCSCMQQVRVSLLEKQ